jgi:uncharacterized protein YidB (DUF937 family)
MGLMDVLNGMMNGPRGPVPPTPTSGGMSPIAVGLLALLAYKAMKGGGGLFGSSAAPPQQPYNPAGAPQQTTQAGASDWLRGLIGGGSAGSILTGGLGELVKRFQQTGQPHVAQSWIGTAPNQSISPTDLEKTVGVDVLEALSRQTGMPRDELLAELSRQLPTTVDKLTPEGRIPSEHEAARWM